MELLLEKLETTIAEHYAASPARPETTNVRAFARTKPARGPLPAHLPCERVVLPG